LSATNPVFDGYARISHSRTGRHDESNIIFIAFLIKKINIGENAFFAIMVNSYFFTELLLVFSAQADNRD
jgi:hypothetical protein